MNKTEQAVAMLQSMIERGELAPGSMVSERTIVEMMGLGRTPIREAIQRLAPSYMIRVHASRGIEIPAITVEDQISRLEVRRATRHCPRRNQHGQRGVARGVGILVGVHAEAALLRRLDDRDTSVAHAAALCLPGASGGFAMTGLPCIEVEDTIASLGALAVAAMLPARAARATQRRQGRRSCARSGRLMK